MIRTRHVVGSLVSLMLVAAMVADCHLSNYRSNTICLLRFVGLPAWLATMSACIVAIIGMGVLKVYYCGAETQRCFVWTVGLMGCLGALGGLAAGVYLLARVPELRDNVSLVATAVGVSVPAGMVIVFETMDRIQACAQRRRKAILERRLLETENAA